MERRAARGGRAGWGAWALAAWALAAGAGCVSSARVGVVDDAAAMLARRQTSVLEARSPALIDEARLRLSLAESARSRGDNDTAAFQAQMAIDRYLAAVRASASNESACRDPDERAAAVAPSRGLFLRLYNGDRFEARPSGLTLRNYDDGASKPPAGAPPADKQAPP